jgi:hypothetical protein
MRSEDVRTKTLQIKVTPSEQKAVREAAKKAGLTVSELCAKLVLDVIQDGEIRGDLPTQKCFEEVRRLRRLFCAIMYRSLSGTLTKHYIERLEKESAE